MKGLLYKDFLMIGGKKICIGIICFLVLFICLRIAFPGTDQAVVMSSHVSDESNMLVKIDVQIGSLADIVLATIGVPVSLCVMLILPVNVPQYISKSGEDRNYQKYMSGMPIDKKDIIAEKYVFAGILAFAALNISLLTMIILKATCVDQKALYIISSCNGMIPLIASYSILCSALVIPFTYRFGTESAVKIQKGLFALLLVAVLAYFCFADWDLFKMIFLSEEGELLEYMAGKQKDTLVFQILSPAIALFIYFVSYKIALVIGMKEYDDD